MWFVVVALRPKIAKGYGEQGNGVCFAIYR
jgi:hypothetical protein